MEDGKQYIGMSTVNADRVTSHTVLYKITVEDLYVSFFNVT